MPRTEFPDHNRKLPPDVSTADGCVCGGHDLYIIRPPKNMIHYEPNKTSIGPQHNTLLSKHISAGTRVQVGRFIVNAFTLNNACVLWILWVTQLKNKINTWTTFFDALSLFGLFFFLWFVVEFGLIQKYFHADVEGEGFSS